MSDKALQIIALALRFSRAVQEDWVREHDILTQIERFLPPKRSSADLGGICIRFAGRMLD
jgi:hypothetical protein